MVIYNTGGGTLTTLTFEAALGLKLYIATTWSNLLAHTLVITHTHRPIVEISLIALL